ncbi:hypothetical protein SAMN04515695_0525 [Pseudovibrio sp. Tun.PSC04-5.I4]|nr:hypothetical protein SAMN04515695_0525 [Pseudovibrio sp. Tun.PSC04-5.I4]
MRDCDLQTYWGPSLHYWDEFSAGQSFQYICLDISKIDHFVRLTSVRCKNITDLSVCSAFFAMLLCAEAVDNFFVRCGVPWFERIENERYVV